MIHCHNAYSGATHGGDVDVENEHTYYGIGGSSAL